MAELTGAAEEREMKVRKKGDQGTWRPKGQTEEPAGVSAGEAE